VTHGEHGWHVHVHAVIVTRKAPDAIVVFNQRARGRARQPYPITSVSPLSFVTDRWAEGLHRQGSHFSATRQGVDWRPVYDARGVSTYVTKGGSRTAAAVGREVALGAIKSGRKASRTPWEILSDAIKTGDADDLALWSQFESGSKGRHQIEWSRGLREFGEIALVTDEEITAEDAGDPIIFCVPSGVFSQMVKRGHDFDLLTVLDRGGVAAGLAFMDANRYAWLSPVQAEQYRSQWRPSD